MASVVSANLNRIHEQKFDLIVGLPRSGMIPAYMIALRLNLPCTDLLSFVNNTPLKSGYTRNVSKAIKLPQEANRILVVDDSIASGQSLKKDLALVPEALRSRIQTCAIYSDIKRRSDVSFFFETVPFPRVFEWNIFHHEVITNSCFDIDGVLCLDPDNEANDDGEKYLSFINSALPLNIPSRKVHAVVTSRLEKYRGETEKWLEKVGVQYDHLIMLDLPNMQVRQEQNNHAEHKGLFYKNSATELFIESDYRQSIEIAKIANKPVYCVDTNEMIQPGVTYQMRVGSVNVIKTTIKRIVPNKLLVPLRKLINK
ncbi:phosphoribosyltransferase family protein [Aliidiomarina shirensis]|nr:phosphoribosyltransferase family protein [Aliidiomarina shirensis]